MRSAKSKHAVALIGLSLTAQKYRQCKKCIAAGNLLCRNLLNVVNYVMCVYVTLLNDLFIDCCIIMVINNIDALLYDLVLNIKLRSCFAYTKNLGLSILVLISTMKGFTYKHY